MIEIVCTHCEASIEIDLLQQLGTSMKVKIFPCNCVESPYPDVIKYIKDLEEDNKNLKRLNYKLIKGKNE